MTDFDSPLAVFQQAVEHEQKMTGMIKNLYTLAAKENDYPAQVLLQWYITEQLEEEKNATNIVEPLKLIEQDRSALLILDRERGVRKANAGTALPAGADAALRVVQS